jgi:hypothetical protein
MMAENAMTNRTQVFSTPGTTVIGNKWVLVLDIRAAFELEI